MLHSVATCTLSALQHQCGSPASLQGHVALELLPDLQELEIVAPSQASVCHGFTYGAELDG